MSRLGGWLRSSVRPDTASSTSFPDAQAFSAQQEKDLDHALSRACLIMNDDIDGAWAELQTGSSCFHSMGSAVIFFIRSVLGFEKSVMAETMTILEKCETSATADQKKAQKLGAGGNVYPPGTEYELVKAQTQLMGAVVGVLHESVVEAVKGFYKMRRAFVTLQGIIAMDEKMLAERQLRVGGTGQQGHASIQGLMLSDDPEDGEERFFDAKEAFSEQATPLEPASNSGAEQNGYGLGSETVPKPQPSRTLSQQETPETLAFTSGIDIFIHTGANLCFGLLSVVLSMVPPAFSRILSVVGFRGDRDQGITMLWRAAAWPNINGALAGMILLGFYNGLLATVDIVPDEKDLDRNSQGLRLPSQKLKTLLEGLRERFPDSQLWKIEEARMHSANQQLAKSVAILEHSSESKMKQITALRVFELAMSAFFLQDWALAQKSLLRCIEINDWSPAMYLYMAGCAGVELYRDAVEKGDLETAKLEKKKAEAQLREAPTRSKKRFMAKQLPFETWISQRTQKFEDRAKAWDADLIDVIGPSPALEICYMWNGQKRMSEMELESAVKVLSWERLTGSEEVKKLIQEDKLDRSAWAISMASLMRRLGRQEAARTVLEEEVFIHDPSFFKTTTGEDYVYPTANYELAVLAWLQCSNPSKAIHESGDAAVAEYQAKKAAECQMYLDKVKNGESFVLEARIGMRVQGGLETMEWWKKKHMK